MEKYPSATQLRGVGFSFGAARIALIRDYWHAFNYATKSHYSTLYAKTTAVRHYTYTTVLYQVKFAYRKSETVQHIQM